MTLPSLDTLAATAAFAFVTSITPGPNNAMLLASGLNFGFRRTIPHLFGINVGFPAMLVAIGLGLGGILAAAPLAYRGLQLVGAAYLIWLAWRIATTRTLETDAAVGRPFTFWQAAAFQWVNPKAWVIATGAVTTFTSPADFGRSLLVLAAVFAVVNLPCIAVWAGLGVTVRRLVSNPGTARAINIALALLLIASLYPTFRSFA